MWQCGILQISKNQDLYIYNMYTLSIQTLKICRVQSETSGIGDFGEIPRVYIGNLGFYHYLEIFGVLLNLRSLCKYNQWFCNYLSDSAKKFGFEFFEKRYPYPTRILPVLTPYLPVFFLANPGFGMKTLGFHYPYPTRILPVLTPYFPVSKIWVRIH